MMHESDSAAEEGGRPKVLQLIRHIRIALLTTFDRGGTFHTRPIQTLGIEDDGKLWFFTDIRSDKADELRAYMRISLGYADTAASHYIAVSGVGTVQQDPCKAQELWKVEQRAYYPAGPLDERLVVLKVQIECAEYGIAPGRMSCLCAALMAAATGKSAEVLGENKRVR